jgi:hypothetical protein
MKDKILDRIIRFDILLGLTAVAIALVAAFFSVYGIATLFAGAFALTAFMASTLEIGKLVAVTYLYRYWTKTKKWLAVYLSIATLVLMLITSMGIFGYLSAAYQKSSLEFKAGQEKITMVEGQKTYLTDKITQAKSRIDTLNKMRTLQESRMNESLTNAFLTRSPIQFKQLQDQTAEMIKTADANIGTEQQTIQKTTDDISKLDQQVNEMKFASANKKDIRTFQFVADQFGTSLDKVAKWFIFTIIFVFDPLAVALILAYNVVTYKKPDEEPLLYTGGKKIDIIEPSPAVQESTNSEKEKLPEEDFPEKSPIDPPESTNSEKEQLVDSPPIPVTNPPPPSSIGHIINAGQFKPRPTWLQ